MTKKRWFEVSYIAKGDTANNEVNDFMKSLEIKKFQQGIEIGRGSQTLGDDVVENKEVKGKHIGMQVISKSIASYTVPARENSVYGKVDLRIVFLSNGKVGRISVICGLPYGLTEQAINAAREIKFIPASVDGVSQTETKRLTYTFTIY